MSSFGERLQQLMDLKKISQKDIVNDLGIHKAQVSKWVLGRTGVPRRVTLQKLADYFECDIEWLSTGSGEPSPSDKPPSEAEKLVENYGKKRSVTKSYTFGWKGYPMTPAKAETKKTEIQPPLQPSPAVPEHLILRFQHIFEFLQECYGEDVVAINDFLTRLDREFLQNDPDYQFWLEERRKAVEERIKKRGGESGVDRLPEKKSANGNG